MRAIAVLCVLPALLGAGPGGATWGALAAGVAAEGPPVLSPLVGPAQERDALARRAQGVPPHHLRHQHHYGDPRLSARHPGPGAPESLPAPLEGAAGGGHFGGGHAGGGYHVGGGHHVGGGPAATACQVNAEEVAALVAKGLEGICNEREISDRFHNLGTLLADQFNVLKTMVLNLEDKVGAMDIGMERAERRLLAAVAKSSRCGRPRGADDLGADEDEDRALVAPGGVDESDPVDEDYDDVPSPALVTAHRDGAQGPGAREAEVQRYNGTVHVEERLADLDAAADPDAPSNAMAGCGRGRRAFNYYWRVANMDYKMTGWNQRRSLRSPSFYVWPGGYRMYLRLYPRQSGENVYVHVGLTRGDQDAALPWPFRLHHRLAVLDQVSTLSAPSAGPDAVPGSGPVDLVSRLWDPSQLCSGYNWQRPSPRGLSPDNYECVGLGFPQSVLRSRSYIRQDAILVKLIVCLDQP